MVWFQCEDCGENLKKPKLANHFRGCPAGKLSCIDCGIIFTQQSVQGHTQCVSEAEKYGPKNVGFIKKETIKTSTKERDYDVLNVSLGLSTQPPWSCSLCNVKATSQETLMLHSQGKKHKSKVRSVTSKSTSKDAVLRVSNAEEGETTISASGSSKKDSDSFRLENCLRKDSAQVDNEDRQPAGAIHIDHREANSRYTNVMKERTVTKEKKRKFSGDDDMLPLDEIRGRTSVVEEGKACIKALRENKSRAEHWGREKHMDEELKRNRKKGVADGNVDNTWCSLVKWKKLIKKALKNAPGGFLKFKQLRHTILPPAMEVVKISGLDINKESFSRELERQIQSHSRFVMEGKLVRLAV